jgi:hypothetical protein
MGQYHIDVPALHITVNHAVGHAYQEAILDVVTELVLVVQGSSLGAHTLRVYCNQQLDSSIVRVELVEITTRCPLLGLRLRLRQRVIYHFSVAE